MEPNIQTTILRNLINDEDYTRSVIPFLKKEYFENNHRVVFDSVVEFVDKYNKLPTQEALSIELTNANIKDGPGVSEVLSQVFTPKDVNKEWLLDETEKWCQDRSIYLAIMESINIIDGKLNTLKKDALPQLLSDALGVCFDTNVGHDYIDNSDDRFEFYNKIEETINEEKGRSRQRGIYKFYCMLSYGLTIEADKTRGLDDILADLRALPNVTIVTVVIKNQKIAEGRYIAGLSIKFIPSVPGQFRSPEDVKSRIIRDIRRLSNVQSIFKVSAGLERLE